MIGIHHQRPPSTRPVLQLKSVKLVRPPFLLFPRPSTILLLIARTHTHTHTHLRSPTYPPTNTRAHTHTSTHPPHTHYTAYTPANSHMHTHTFTHAAPLQPNNPPLRRPAHRAHTCNAPQPAPTSRMNNSARQLASRPIRTSQRPYINATT